MGRTVLQNPGVGSRDRIVVSFVRKRFARCHRPCPVAAEDPGKRRSLANVFDTPRAPVVWREHRRPGRNRFVLHQAIGVFAPCPPGGADKPRGLGGRIDGPVGEIPARRAVHIGKRFDLLDPAHRVCRVATEFARPGARPEKRQAKPLVGRQALDRVAKTVQPARLALVQVEGDKETRPCGLKSDPSPPMERQRKVVRLEGEEVGFRQLVSRGWQAIPGVATEPPSDGCRVRQGACAVRARNCRHCRLPEGIPSAATSDRPFPQGGRPGPVRSPIRAKQATDAALRRALAWPRPSSASPNDRDGRPLDGQCPSTACRPR